MIPTSELSAAVEAGFITKEQASDIYKTALASTLAEVYSKASEDVDKWLSADPSTTVGTHA